jgi:flagellar biosynthesis GTPase FlhF
MDPDLTAHLAARQAARDELKRKLEEEEEEDRVIKRIQSEESKQKEAEENKRIEMLESAQAGEWELPFGKHKGKAIKDTDASYLAWMMGFKQKRNFFVETTHNEAIPYITDNHPESLENVKKFLTWRCWLCHCPKTAFKTAKLCTDCWKKAKI